MLHWFLAEVMLIAGHRAVYKATRVLHRDISVNNIMFYYEPDGSVVGVLCDWDLAKEVLDSHVTTEVITDDLLMSNLVFLTDVEKSGDVPQSLVFITDHLAVGTTKLNLQDGIVPWIENNCAVGRFFDLIEGWCRWRRD